jgi:Ca-activated chloride channel homolog
MSQLNHDDWRITAYALGELEGAERAEVEAFLESDEAARQAVEDVRGTANVLASELLETAQAAPELTSAQRQSIEARASSTSAPRGRVFPMRTAGAIAATGLILVAAGIYAESVMQSESGTFIGAVADSAPAVRQEIEYSRESSAGGAASPSTGSAPGRVAQSLKMETLELHALGYVGGEHDDLDGANLIEEEAEDTEAYDYLAENPFLLPGASPLSTFSIDVDTASYSNVRRMLVDGQAPPVDAVRIEELINYFPYEYEAPTGKTPFSVAIEVAGCAWQPEHRLVRIGLKGREIDKAERKASNLVFLLDVSGSMNQANKLPLLKRSMSLLVENLDERDSVAIAVYAGASGVVLEPTNAGYGDAILQAVDRLSAGGSTNGGAGIQLAYQMATENFIEGGINRVILATDGDFNVGVSSDGALQRLIEDKAKSGVFLTVLGFGTGNIKDSKMEMLADKGNGNYAYIDSLMEARKVLVEQMGATLETIAKDVKIQVEFNPVEVAGYRLIGYENRMMAAQDFRDDTKDAGEIGAGHMVTALYEIVPAGRNLDIPGVDPLRYQTANEPSGLAWSGELMTVSLRYKLPDQDIAAEELKFPVKDTGNNFFEASSDTRFAAAIAGFGMLLRESKYKNETTWDDVRTWALEASSEDPGGYRAAFLELVDKAKAISGQ